MKKIIRDGMVLQKTSYRERDLVIKILASDGLIYSGLSYGGQGGGKKQTGLKFEIGQVFRFEMKFNPTLSSSMSTLGESILQWSHDKLRSQYEAFLLLLFYVDFTLSVSPEGSLKDQVEFAHESQRQGLYRLLTSAVYYLEQAVKDQNFQVKDHFFLFLVKLSFELGIQLEMSSCVLCGHDFTVHPPTIISPDHGGFICSQCQKAQGSFIVNRFSLYADYQGGMKTFFKDVQTYHMKHGHWPEELINHLEFQLNVSLKNKKSYSELKQTFHYF